ncbi:hypothetical protein [Specibacter sp. NPDC078709]|uniref:hypothetical protein n=1 Tax=Specibacter sp. NPDC078709 TaxID=3154364 RepID=UPI00343D7098
MAEILHHWEFIGIVNLENRLTRIVNDSLRRIHRLKKLDETSKLVSICRAYRKLTPINDSLPGNLVSGLESIIEIHTLLAQHPMQSQELVRHPNTSSILSENLRKAMEGSWIYTSGTAENSTLGLVSRGYITSLLEGRSSGSRVIADAVVKRSATVAKFGMDIGAMTYGTVGEAHQYKTPGILWHSANYSTNSTVTVLYSGNVAFLRRYLGRIFFYLIAQPQLSAHIHIVADSAEALSFITEADSLLMAMHSFAGRDSDVPSIAWSSSVPPEAIGNLITYFACARYLVALDVMTKHDSAIWIQDVDLFPTSPITNTKDSLDLFDVALVQSDGLNFMAPWRRYLAGNVYINQTDNAREFLRFVSEYITFFLSREHSWMLDQNALDWAVEKCSDYVRIGNMKHLNINLTQSIMNSAIES